MQAPVAVMRSAGSSVAYSTHAVCCGAARHHLAGSSGLRTNGVQRPVRNMLPCGAESGEDRMLDTDPAVGRAEVVDAYSAAAAESESGSGDAVNVWDSKPLWCQPWTIVLTGATIDALAWKASGGSLLVTGLVGVPIVLWWYLFLGVMPAQYAEYVQQIAAEGRRRWQ